MLNLILAVLDNHRLTLSREALRDKPTKILCVSVGDRTESTHCANDDLLQRTTVQHPVKHVVVPCSLTRTVTHIDALHHDLEFSQTRAARSSLEILVAHRRARHATKIVEE